MVSLMILLIIDQFERTSEMTTYADQDVQRGSGAFDQAMRIQQCIPGNAERMTPGIAIGIIAAAIRSGLPASKFDEVFDSAFAHSAAFLKRILAMFEGDDWSVNLWHRLPSGQYKLCTALCQLSHPGWRYNRNGGSADLD